MERKHPHLFLGPNLFGEFFSIYLGNFFPFSGFRVFLVVVVFWWCFGWFGGGGGGGGGGGLVVV